MTDAPAKPRPRPRGILCPDCAEPMGAHKTRRHANVITRRRLCPHCGRRLTTQERPVTS